MCQNDAGNRATNQGNPSQTPGRDDPSRKPQGQTSNPPGRHEDDEDLYGNKNRAGGQHMGRDKQDQNAMGGRDASKDGNEPGEEINGN